MFKEDDLVVIDRESIAENIERYKEIHRPWSHPPHPVYDGVVGSIYHKITIPFKGYNVDWGDELGMTPMHEWEIKEFIGVEV